MVLSSRGRACTATLYITPGYTMQIQSACTAAPEITRGCTMHTQSACTAAPPITPRYTRQIQAAYTSAPPRGRRSSCTRRGPSAHDVEVQAQEPRFKLKALLSFSQSNFETGRCFQAGVSLHLRPTMRGLLLRGVGVQV